MKIERLSLEMVETAATLFNDYRMFYEQESNIAGAMEFLTARLKAQDSIVFLAFDEEKCVGFVQLYPTFSSVAMQRAYILNDLFVAVPYRKKGFAKVLMKAAFSYCEEHGARYVTLETGLDNYGAQALYKQVGMVEDTSVKHFLKYWE